MANERIYLDKWNFYMKDCNSPQMFIDMGFYAMIMAALQRRVWLGSNSRKLHVNDYVVLIGPPSVGKGMVLQPVSGILKANTIAVPKVESVESQAARELAQAKNFDIGSLDGVKKHMFQPVTERMLIPVAADATTYEALIREITLALRAHVSYETVNGERKAKRFLHRSICFCLEELSSLFRKNSSDTTKFLLQGWDCGDYTYATKTQNTDIIKDMCVNVLAGTTPDFLKDSMVDRLVGDGLASRIIFVYEHLPRANKFGPIKINDEQEQARLDIIDYVEKLSEVHGLIRFSAEETPEAFEIMRKYFEEVLPKKRVNPHPKLDHYYGRKNVHAQKLAAAIHFSYSTELELFPYDCTMALKILDYIERNMHYAFLHGRSPLSHLITYIITLMQKIDKPLSRNFIHGESMHEGREDEIEEVLNTLMRSGHVELTGPDMFRLTEKGKATNKPKKKDGEK